jgi:hypothetical protein
VPDAPAAILRDRTPNASDSARVGASRFAAERVERAGPLGFLTLWAAVLVSMTVPLIT